MQTAAKQRGTCAGAAAALEAARAPKGEAAAADCTAAPVDRAPKGDAAGPVAGEEVPAKHSI